MTVWRDLAQQGRRHALEDESERVPGEVERAPEATLEGVDVKYQYCS